MKHLRRLTHGSPQLFRIADVRHDYSHPFAMRAAQPFPILLYARAGEIIVQQDGTPLLQQVMREIGADKARAAGNKNS